MYAARSARDRMQGRLYANADREFDQGPTFPLREGVRTTIALGYTCPSRAFLCAGLFQPRRANARREWFV